MNLGGDVVCPCTKDIDPRLGCALPTAPRFGCKFFKHVSGHVFLFGKELTHGAFNSLFELASRAGARASLRARDCQCDASASLYI